MITLVPILVAGYQEYERAMNPILILNVTRKREEPDYANKNEFCVKRAKTEQLFYETHGTTSTRTLFVILEWIGELFSKHPKINMHTKEQASCAAGKPNANDLAAGSCVRDT